MKTIEIIHMAVLAGFFLFSLFVFLSDTVQEIKIYRQNLKYNRIYHNTYARGNLKDLSLHLFIVLFCLYFSGLFIMLIAKGIYETF